MQRNRVLTRIVRLLGVACSWPIAETYDVLSIFLGAMLTSVRRASTTLRPAVVVIGLLVSLFSGRDLNAAPSIAVGASGPAGLISACQYNLPGPPGFFDPDPGYFNPEYGNCTANNSTTLTVQETTDSSNSPPGYLGNASATASILSNSSLFSFVGNASQNGSASCDDCFTVDAAFSYNDGSLRLGTLPQSNGTSSNPGVSVTPLSGGNEQVNIILAYQLTGTALPPNPSLTNGAILLVAVGTTTTIQYIYTDIEAASPNKPVFTYANVALGTTGSSPSAGLLSYRFTVPASTTIISLSIQAYAQASSNGPSTMTLTLNALTCKDIEQNLKDQLNANKQVSGQLITNNVTAPYGLTMEQAANTCGFANFDWVQTIESMPPYILNIVNGYEGLTLTTPYIDPIPNGYKYQAANPPSGCNASNGRNTSNPYYFDVFNSQGCQTYNVNDHGAPFSLNFADAPIIACLSKNAYGNSCYRPGDFSNFCTQLVGVLSDDQGNPTRNYDKLGAIKDCDPNGISFAWQDNGSDIPPTPATGGPVPALQNLAPVPPGSTGGPIITAINGVPTVSPLTSGQSCDGTFDGLFTGDVTVSAGQNCTLTNNCEIKGNVSVNGGSFNLACVVDGTVTQNGGSLDLGLSTVNGNVHISGASAFAVGPSATIGRNLQIQYLSGGLPQGTVCGTQIKGNLQVQNNASSIEIGGTSQQGCAGNTVGGDLLVDANTAGVKIDKNTVAGALHVDNDSATTDVSGNSVGKNLECQNNNIVTHTASNMVTGQNQGQCAAFP